MIANASIAERDFIVESLDVASEIERCIFDDEHGCYDLPLHAQERLRERFVTEAYAQQLQSCSLYADFAERERSRLGRSAATPCSLAEIPRLPTSVFKRRAVSSVLPEQIAKRCVSSGTQGPVSVVARDGRSLERLLGSVRQGLTLLDRWYEDEVAVINLGPDRQAAGDIWFPYVMSLIELEFPTTHCVTGGAFDPDLAIRLIQVGLDTAAQVGIVGPPFFMLEVAQRVEALGVQLGAAERCTVLTAGGWKGRAGESVPRRSFTEKVMSAFRLDDAGQVRDVFNQVELNTVLFECSARAKHVPPWLHAAALDPSTWDEQPDGVPGLLSFLDASATSYPALIVGDDIGKVWRGPCRCGREGVFVDVTRRLERRAQRGCALALGQRYRSGQ